MARKITLHSPYKPIPLARILEEEMDREWTQKEKNKGRVMGEGTEKKIMLRVVKHNVRNDFAICLQGTMSEARGGTRIDAKIGRARHVSIFMIFWFGFLGFFILTSQFLISGPDTPLSFRLPFLGIPLVMILIGILMLKFGGRNAGQDGERIVAFLQDTVKAREQRDG